MVLAHQVIQEWACRACRRLERGAAFLADSRGRTCLLEKLPKYTSFFTVAVHAEWHGTEENHGRATTMATTATTVRLAMDRRRERV